MVIIMTCCSEKCPNCNYDPNNVFAKILRNEIPCKRVHETEKSLAFHDVNPRADVHVLIIPKGPYVNIYHFTRDASSQEQSDFWRCVRETTDKLELLNPGFKILVNTGPGGGQEVPHFHTHLLANK